MKSSVFGRSIQLINMASRLAQSEVGKNMKKGFSKDVASDLLKTRVSQAKLLADNLSQLKGAAMKAGQLLSLDSSDFFPPEVVEVLSRLQESAEPVSFNQIESVLDRDIKAENREEILELDTQAFASASIGQVHRAVYRGEEIVLKVQYPGVADSIDSDLRILKKIAQGFISVSGRKMDLNQLFEEMKTILKQEADYERERQALEKFQGLLAGDSDFVIPKAFPEISSKRVLAMTYESGLGFNQWLKTNPSREDRDFVGKRVLDLYCKEFFEWGVVQTDPNYANFKIQTQPLRIVLLDFGATVYYTEDFRRQYVELLKTFATFDRDKILAVSKEFGLIDARETDETKANFVEFLKSSIEPFFPHVQPFKFRDEDFAKKAQAVGREFTQSLRYSTPPEKIVFLHRKLGGIFNMLRKMDCELDLEPYWEKMVGQKFQLPKEA